MCHINVLAIFEHNALLLQYVYASVDDLLVKLEVRNAVAQQSTCRLVLVKHRHAVALEVQAVCSHQTRRSCTDDRHLLAVAFGVVYAYKIFSEGMLRYGSLVLAVCCRLMLHEVEHARLLAERRTDTSCKLGEVVCRVQQTVCQLPVAFKQGVVPLWRLVAQRACPVAERHATVHAARCLLATVIAVQGLLHFAKVVDAVMYWSIPRLFARDS